MELPSNIITNLHNQVITQTIIINTLCDILVESGIISADELVDRIKTDVSRAEKLISKIKKSSKKPKKSKKSKTNDEDFIYDFLDGYDGPIGEA